jgi:hypothetical protein
MYQHTERNISWYVFSATFYLQKKNKHSGHLQNLLTAQQWTEMMSIVNVLSVEPYNITVMPKYFMHDVYAEY